MRRVLSMRTIIPCLTVVLLSACEPGETDRVVEGGDPDSGKLMMEFYQCGSCHRIPGISGADGVVGPPLDFYSRRSFIAGSVPNNPDNLTQFLHDPHSIRPDSAMPNVGATIPEARDMAAYLYTLD